MNHSGRMGQMNTKQFLQIWSAVLLSFLISTLISGPALASGKALLPGQPADGNLIDFQVRGLSLGLAGGESQNQKVLASIAIGEPIWYRNEYGRLFNASIGRSYPVLMGLLRGEYPSWILAGDQQALGLSDLVLETLGYIKANQDWEYRGSGSLLEDPFRFQHRYEPK